MDNRFSERQMRMLPHILHVSWEEGKPFEALADVGVFPSVNQDDVVVLDFLLSLGVTKLYHLVDGRYISMGPRASWLRWVWGSFFGREPSKASIRNG